MLDFAAFPPEINSALMYSGAGSGPLMAAAATWSNLAAELSTTASSWESIIGTLTGSQWTGAGSMAAAASAQPIVEWLTSTAAAAEQASTLASASAAAYEAAFTGTVPPPVIAANRTQLAALVATNFLGINTPAIMATEALYAAMWVQDAVTMYAYQAASTAAAALQPLLPATPASNPGAAGLQQGAVAAAAANATASPAVSAAVSPAASVLGGGAIGEGLWDLAGVLGLQPVLSAADGILGSGAVFNTINGAVNTAAWFVMNAIPTSVSLGHTLAGVTPAAAVAADSVTPLAGGAIGGSLVNSVGGAGVAGAIGEAEAIGGLSVPAGWSGAIPATTVGATAAEGSGWAVAAEESAPVAAMPGMPGMAAAAKGAGAYGAGPRYGFKPIVMPKQVLV